MSHVNKNTETFKPREKRRPPPLKPKPKIIRQMSSGMKSTTSTAAQLEQQRAFVENTASPVAASSTPCQPAIGVALSVPPRSPMNQIERSEEPEPPIQREKPDSNENWKAPSDVKDIAYQINEETKMKVEKLKEQNDHSEVDLTLLKNEYDAGYQRLALGKWMRSMGNRANRKERELYNAVSLGTIHQCPNNQTAKTVLVVGGPGEGKTTSAIKYTNRAMRGEIIGPSDVKVILFIEGKYIEWKRKCRPFELLFKDRLASIFTSAESSKPLEKWIAENPSKVLVVIDGIDISEIQSNIIPTIILEKKVQPISIIINLLRGDIYGGMWVMCTTTPQWLWKLTYVIDIPIVNIVGFNKKDVLDILVQLTGERQRAGLLLHRYPAIKDMCKTPAMLIHLAGQIKENETMSDIKILLDAINFFNGNHAGDEKIINKKMKFVMAVAYKAAVGGTVDLEIQDSDKNTAHAMAHYISVTFDPINGKFSGKKIEDHHLRYTFISEAMRDILAAFHWLSMEKNKRFKNLQDELSSTNIHNYILLGVAIIADSDKWRVVTSISKIREDTLRDLQKVLLKILETKIKGNTISGVNDLRIIRQCTPLLARGAMTGVTSIKLDVDCDAADVLSVAQSIPSIAKVKANSSMTIYSSSLALLEGKYDLKIANLRIAGDMREDAERLSHLLARCSHSKEAGAIAFEIGSVELSDSNMKYDVATKRLEVEELDETTIGVINDLFHFTSGGAYIEVQRVNMENLSKQGIRSLLERIVKLPDDGNKCVLKVKELTCPEQTHLPNEIKDLMTKTDSSIQVDILNYGDVTARPQKQWRYPVDGNNPSRLVTCKTFTASSALVSLVESGAWNEILTREFNISLEFETDGDEHRYPATIRVQRGLEIQCDHEAYEQIVPFMIKLGCKKLHFNDNIITTQYIVENGEKKVDKITLCNSTDEFRTQASGKATQYSDMVKSMFQSSDAKIIQIGSLTFHRYCTDHPTIEWNYKVVTLESKTIKNLKYIQSLLTTPKTRVGYCLLNLSEISSLQELASNISQIDDLHLTVENVSKIVDLNRLIQGITWNKLNLHLPSLHIIIDKNTAGYITVPEMTVDEFWQLFKSVSCFLEQYSVFRVEKLILPQEHREHFKKVIESFTNVGDNTKAVHLEVGEVVVDGNFIDALLITIKNESRFLIVSKIQSYAGTDIGFQHDQNNTIQEVSINFLSVESLFDIHDELSRTGAVRSNCVLWIRNCYFKRSEFEEQAVRLKDILAFNTTIWNISSLQVQAPLDVEVFKAYNELLRSGQIKEMVFQDEFEFRTGRCSGEHNGELFGNIDHITVRGLKSVLDSLSVDRPKIMKIGQCEIEVIQDDVPGSLSGMKNKDLFNKIMNLTMEETRKTTKEQIDMLEAITLQNKDLRIKTITITGSGIDIEAIATDAITGNDDSNYLLQVETVKFETLTMDNYRLMAKVMNSRVGLEANCLIVNEPKENFVNWTTTMDMISNTNFKASSIKSKHNLDQVLQIINEISPIVQPKTIITEDANLKVLKHPGTGTEILVAEKGDVKSNSIRSLSRSMRIKVTTKSEYEKGDRIHPPPPPSRLPLATTPKTSRSSDAPWRPPPPRLHRDRGDRFSPPPPRFRLPLSIPQKTSRSSGGTSSPTLFQFCPGEAQLNSGVRLPSPKHRSRPPPPIPPKTPQSSEMLHENEHCQSPPIPTTTGLQQTHESGPDYDEVYSPTSTFPTPRVPHNSDDELPSDPYQRIDDSEGEDGSPYTLYEFN